MKLISSILFVSQCISILKSEYIPPGPKYNCPKNTQLLYPCVCETGTDDGLYVRCENSGLAVLSVGLGNLAGLQMPIEKLVIKDCQIFNLFGPLLHRSQVRILYIENTPIKSIDEYVFSGINRTLQELYMYNTQLEHFPKDAFKVLDQLTTLEINGHLIKSLEQDIMVDSSLGTRLEKLRIVNGLIGKIPIQPFQRLAKLKSLDLHGNRIAHLENNQFKGLKNLDMLDLSFNNITNVMGTHLRDLTNLGFFNISHNSLTQLNRGTFAKNILLKVVHLDHNKIKALNANSFKGMRYLRRLYLNDNQISDAGRGTFGGLIVIATVELARNLITKVDYQMFHEVKYAELINLAENNITMIEKQAFTGLYQTTVNISHNALTVIEPGAFENCINLTLLDLSYNQLEGISKNAFDYLSYPLYFQLSYNQFSDFLKIPIQNMSGMQIFNASHNQLVGIPRNAFPKSYDLHTIDLSNNQIREIYSSVLQTIGSLRYLVLKHNSLEQIKPGTFGTIYTLLELDLSYNNLRDISRGALAKLASCSRLDVSHNQLDKIFQIPISLGELNMAHNNLTEIKANTWPTMNALLRLNLSSNALEDRLDSNSFRGLLTLQKLDLSSNAMASPPWEALNSMTSLQYLYLQDNNLTALTKASFGNLPTIFELHLSHNQISDVARQAFLGMQQLITLNLQHNRLRNIPNEAFKGLVALRNLDLSHNNLYRIDNKTHGLFDDCLSIDKVDLSYNNFSTFTKKMFPSNPYIPYKLRDINLSYNHFSVITYEFTIGNKKLRKLNISNNNIVDIRNYVLGNLTELEYLDISHNKLRDLVSSFSVSDIVLPENLTTLILSDNVLEVLPIEKIKTAPKLKVLNVKNNKLSIFDPELVKKIRKDGLELYIDGNMLLCDCLTRPLIHYLNRRKVTDRIKDEKYNNLICEEPKALSGEKIVDLDENRLVCDGNTELDLSKYKHKEEFVYDFESEPDLAIRDIQYSQEAIHVHWFVYTTEDVANTNVFIINSTTNNELYTNEVVYNTRSLTIPLDGVLIKAIQDGGLSLCVLGISSENFGRNLFLNQCKQMPKDYYSWPKKLVIDKRRLTKKNRKYYRSSVLSLVSDSILITLCIFLGVCLTKLSDIYN